MTGLDQPHQTRRAIAADGTPITYVVVGEGPRDFVFCPGLGGPLVTYRKLFRHFAGRYRFVTWEPRGLFSSGVPGEGERALRVEDHVSDLEAIVARERLGSFHLGGWSMGVQLSLEYAHRHPERCAALVLVNGAYGRILDNVPGGERLPSALIRLLSRAGPLIDLNARLFLDTRPMVAALHRVGYFRGHPEEFQVVLGEFKQLDFGRYLRMVLALHQHTAETYLHELEIPTLVTAGTHDWMASPSVGRELVRRLPNAELFLIENGTHYSLVEHPETVQGAIEEFLERVQGRAERQCA